MGWKPLGLVSLAAVSILACSHIFQEVDSTTNPNSPSSTASATPSPIPIVVVPVPVPTAPSTTLAPAPAPTNPTNPLPGPGPAPTAAPGPTPTAAPTTAPPPTGGSCSLPPGTGSGNDCPRLSASFQDEVNAAITQLFQQRPDIFGGSSGPNKFVVKHDDYMNGVVGNLRARGLCAIVDSDDEIAVKNSNAFNDQYDILASSGNTRSDGSYSATCSPAWF